MWDTTPRGAILRAGSTPYVPHRPRLSHTPPVPAPALVRHPSGATSVPPHIARHPWKWRGPGAWLQRRRRARSYGTRAPAHPGRGCPGSARLRLTGRGDGSARRSGGSAGRALPGGGRFVTMPGHASRRTGLSKGPHRGMPGVLEEIRVTMICYTPVPTPRYPPLHGLAPDGSDRVGFADERREGHLHQTCRHRRCYRGARR